MCEHVRADVSLPSLDEFDVGFHSRLGVLFRKQVRYVSIRMQTSELKLKVSRFLRSRDGYSL